MDEVQCKLKMLNGTLKYVNYISLLPYPTEDMLNIQKNINFNQDFLVLWVGVICPIYELLYTRITNNNGSLKYSIWVVYPTFNNQEYGIF